MKIKTLLTAYILTVGFCAVIGQSQKANSITETELLEKAQALNLHPGIYFEKNLGQWEDGILYSTYTSKGHVYFMEDKLSFGVRRVVEDDVEDPLQHEEKREMLVWNLEFQGYNPDYTTSESGLQQTRNSYLRGNDFSKHAANVPEFSIIKYEDLYPSIDAQYYGNKGHLKYDFIVHPGGSMNNIKLKYDGVEGLAINRKGELEVTTPWGAVIDKAPYSYQMINGEQREVDVRYELYPDYTFGFKVYGEYDPNHDLVIDPIVLEWSTYAGGEGAVPYVDPYAFINRGQEDGYFHDLHVNDDGSVFAVGFHSVGYWTTPGVYDSSFNNAWYDVIAAKLKNDGSAVEWATYIGGNWDERAMGLAVDQNGDLYIGGFIGKMYAQGNQGAQIPDAGPANFPVTYDNGLRGVTEDTHQGNDAFLLKLAGTGDRLLYSALIGGSKGEEIVRGAVSVNSSGEVFAAGVTSSNDFPTTSNAFSRNYNGGNSDAFVVKLNAAGNGIDYATYLGGSAADNAMLYDDSDQKFGPKGGGLEINDNDDIFVCGWTFSSDFPTSNNARQSNLQGEADAFITKLNSNGSLAYSTYLGGSLHDNATDLTIDENDAVYVVGGTYSSNFPTTAGVFDRTNRGNQYLTKRKDGFIAKLNTQGQLDYSTFIGEDKEMDLVMGIDLNSRGEAYIVGETFGYSSMNPFDFPVTTCGLFQAPNNIGTQHDVFMAKISADASTIQYATLFGGERFDYQGKIKVQEKEGCYEEVTVSMGTHSLDWHSFPLTQGVYQDFKPQQSVDIPAVFRLKPELDIEFTMSENNPGCGDPVIFNGTANAQCMWDGPFWNATTWFWDFGDGTTSTAESPTHVYQSPGTYTVTFRAGCPSGETTRQITVTGSGVSVDLGPDITTCQAVNQPFTVGNLPPGSTVNWSTGSTSPSITVTSAGTYWVSVSNGSCETRDTVIITELPGLEPTITRVVAPPCGSIGGSAQANPADGGGNGPYSYVWSNGQTTRQVTGLSEGTYTVTVTNGAGCSGTASVELTANSGLQASITSIVQPQCGGVSGEATAEPSDGGASGPYTYLWSDGQTTKTAIGLTPGPYTVTITNKDGCDADATTDITGDSGFDLDISIVYDDGCDRWGGSLGNATATPSGGAEPFTYKWSDPAAQQSQTAIGLKEGTYNVTVTDANGCVMVASATIERKIQISFNVDSDPCSSCNDGQITGIVGGFGTPPFTYRWNDSNEQTTLTATGLPPGEYVLLVTDSGGCFHSDTITIGMTGIDNRYADNKLLEVYPNPNTGHFRVQLPGKSQGTVNIFNATGALVQNRVMNNSLLEIVLAEPSGVYFIQVVTPSKTYTQRVLISGH